MTSKIRGLEMIIAIAMTLTAIILGDAVTALLQIPVPGAIMGLLCAASYFVWRGSPHPAMARMFDAVIPHAPILFVPAGAGVVANLDVIAGGFLAIVSVITLGTVATLIVTGVAMQALLRAKPRAECAG
jgi:holin-like protein